MQTETTRQINFEAVIPVLATNDLDKTLNFYKQFNFEVAYSDEEYAILEHGPIQIHFEKCDITNLDNMSACRIKTDNIEELYQQCQALNCVHPNGLLQTQPWGSREFAIIDPSGVLVTFHQPLS